MPGQMQPHAYGQPTYGAAGHMLAHAGGPHNVHTTQKVFAGMPHKEKPGVSASSKLGLPALIALVMIPWFIFAVVLYAQGMYMRYAYPGLSLCLSGWFFIFTLVVGVMAVSAAKNKQGDPKLLGLTFVFCLVAWLTAWSIGEHIFIRYTRAYNDLNALATYPNVDPTQTTGAQMMDAGIIQFSQGAKLDLKKTIGFKNEDTYCVAPVTMEGAGPEQKKFNFWAIGTNCCSSHTSNYKCGEWNFPSARMGLRLMDDDQRPYFRLAVQEAEATYNIEAAHPVFFYWLTDAVGEVEVYQEDAFKYFLMSVCIFPGVQLFLVLMVAFTVFQF